MFIFCINHTITDSLTSVTMGTIHPSNACKFLLVKNSCAHHPPNIDRTDLIAISFFDNILERLSNAILIVTPNIMLPIKVKFLVKNSATSCKKYFNFGVGVLKSVQKKKLAQPLKSHNH